MIHYSLFIRNQGANLLSCPRFGPLLAGLCPAPLPSYLFTLTFFVCKAMTCCLVRYAPPSSSSRREEEERRARCRRRRGFGANEDGPVLLQDSLVLCGKHGIGLVQTRMPSASLSAAAPLARTLPVTSSLFSYLLLPRSALPGPQGPTKERIQTKKGHPSGCPFLRFGALSQ